MTATGRRCARSTSPTSAVTAAPPTSTNASSRGAGDARHRLVATLAYRGTEPVAGTVNFEKPPHLYGRYWGCLEDFQMLHFELCYYG